LLSLKKEIKVIKSEEKIMMMEFNKEKISIKVAVI